MTRVLASKIKRAVNAAKYADIQAVALEGINQDIANANEGGMDTAIELIIADRARIKAARKPKKITVAAAPKAKRLVKYFKKRFTKAVKKPPKINCIATKKAFFIYAP